MLRVPVIAAAVLSLLRQDSQTTIPLGGNAMKRTMLSMLVLMLFASALHAVSVSAATSVFATGMDIPESITQTASGNFYVTDADGSIWNVPAGGGSATKLASVTYSLRGGLILPGNFVSPGGQSVGGQFLVVGGVANTSTPADASTMNATFTLSPYASQPNSLWTQPVFAPSFGSYSGDILVTNQGSGTGTFDGSVDFFTPSGTVGKIVTLSSVHVPFGAALAPASFGDVGGTLLVTDAGGSGIYAVDSTGNVTQFTTIPLAAGQSGLRQIAFAPKGFGQFGGDLFVSVANGVIDVVNRDGSVIGQISGAFNPRGLLFTTVSGNPSLLFSNTRSGQLLKAGPGDVVPGPH